MSRRILVITSYEGYRHETRIHPSRMLYLQAEQLKKLHHNLDKVVMVVNEDPEHKHSQEYEDALLEYPWEIMRNPNSGSYGGWRDAFINHPNYEWYFFLEDDYAYFVDDFDQIMIDMWTSSTTYLCSRIGTGPKHASCSAGLLHKSSWENVDWSKYDVSRGEYNSQVQIDWAYLFGIDGLREISADYDAPFWTGGGINDTHPGKPILIGPMQML